VSLENPSGSGGTLRMLVQSSSDAKPSLVLGVPWGSSVGQVISIKHVDGQSYDGWFRFKGTRGMIQEMTRRISQSTAFQRLQNTQGVDKDDTPEGSQDARQVAFWDVGAGSGWASVWMKAALPGLSVSASDVVISAASLTAENVALNNLEVDVFVGDLFEAFNSSHNANFMFFAPPQKGSTGSGGHYSQKGGTGSGSHYSLGGLAGVRERTEAEDAALVAGESGSELFDRFAADAAAYLKDDGVIFLGVDEHWIEHCKGIFARDFTFVSSTLHEPQPMHLVVFQKRPTEREL